MKSRLLAILLVLVMALVMIPAVSAQEIDPCLGLSADDCAILQASDAKAEELNSLTMGFNFNLEIGGLATLGAMMGTADESVPNSITITADAANSPFVAFPDATEPLKSFALAMDVNGSVAGTGSSDTSGTTSFVIVDGNFYMKDPASGEWIGFSLKEAVESGMLAEMGLPFDPAAMLEGDMSSMQSAADPAAALAAAGLTTDQVTALMSVPGFLSQTRAADAELHGQKMIAFESTVDLVPLFASTEFQEVLTAAASASGDDSSMAQVGQIGMILPMLVKEGNVKVTRWIGADDQFPHRAVIEVNASVDVGAMMGGASADAPAMEPITLKLVLDVDLSGHNATAAPVAPEGATMKTLEELQGSGS